jgi:hypothetical protein
VTLRLMPCGGAVSYSAPAGTGWRGKSDTSVAAAALPALRA